jgi:hypothetical protein
MTRAIAILLGTGVAGVLIWTTAQVHRGSTGGYWGEVAILAAAGLILGLSRLVDRGAGRTLVLSAPTFAIAFLPTLIAAGWIIVAGQPNGSWLQHHVTSWSSDISVTRVVADTTAFAAVLAFGLGVLLSLVAERRATAVAEPVPPIGTREPTPAPSPIDNGDREHELVGHS